MDGRAPRAVPVDPATLADLVLDRLPDGLAITPTAAVAAALADRGRDAAVAEVGALPPADADAVLLLAGELDRAGDHAEGLLAAAASALRPGGVLAVAARNRVFAAALGADLGEDRAWSADELVRTVGHPGLDIEHVSAPGAAAALRGDAAPAPHPHLDRAPGLLDAAPRTLVVARRPAGAAGRSAAFFASVPRKIVASAVVCRDADGRLLCVHDTFKRHWTIPGGVVDADEDPRSAARREALEESGVPVAVGPLVGVFALSWPDRVLFVYAAVPERHVEPVPLHAHEVDAAVWLPLPEAMARLNPGTAAQVRRCLEQPGGTWDEQR